MAVRTVAVTYVKVIKASITDSPTLVVQVLFPEREEERDAPGEHGKAGGATAEEDYLGVAYIGNEQLC